MEGKEIEHRIESPENQNIEKVLQDILCEINAYNVEHGNSEKYELSEVMVDKGATACIYPLTNYKQIVKLVDVRDKEDDRENVFSEYFESRQDFLQYRIQEIKYLNKVKGCPYIVTLQDAYEIVKSPEGGYTVTRKLDENTDYAEQIDENVAYYILVQKYYVPLELYIYMVPISEQDIFNILTDVLHALEVLEEEHSLLHNDIKVENVFVDVQTEEDRPHFVLGDLGAVAAIKPGRRNEFFEICPEEYCIPPELEYSRAVYGFQSDIYLVGRLVLRLFGSYIKQEDIADRIQTAEDEAVDGFKFDTRIINTSAENEAFSRIIHKVVRSDPYERYANAKEMLEALRGCEFQNSRMVPIKKDFNKIHNILNLKDEDDYVKQIDDLEKSIRNQNKSELERNASRILQIHLKMRQLKGYRLTEEELDFIKKQADNNNPEAMLIYANHCYDTKERDFYVEQAAKQQYPEACKWQYLRMWNSKKDQESVEALDWLMKAVLRGDSDAAKFMEERIQRANKVRYSQAIRNKLVQCERLMKLMQLQEEKTCK